MFERRFARWFAVLILLLPLVLSVAASAQVAPEKAWLREFPETDFATSSIDFREIVTDGPRRDQIPPIHEPKFVAAAAASDVGPLEPVLSVVVGDDARAYPLRILLWHEIVNDTVGGIPLLVSYCPLCNSGVVFDRRVGEEVLKFGNTGRIRHFDMVMYDQNTESWWQQFLGEAIVGELTGQKMKPFPARLESLAKFRERAPQGKLLVPDDERARPYGTTPYRGMDTSAPPPFSRYPLPSGVRSTARVVIVGEQAWTLGALQKAGKIVSGDIEITWVPGQNSIHDRSQIRDGRDVGNVIVKKRENGKLTDIPYDVSFAFAFSAFRPGGTLHTE